MGITQKNQLLIAFKKLLGKAHTNSSFGPANESVSTNIQLGLKNIFSEAIPSAPTNTTPWGLTANSNGFYVAECIEFNVVQIPLSLYSNTNGVLSSTTIDEEGDAAVSGYHAYSLQLPSDYNLQSYNPSNMSFPFIDSTNFSSSNGLLQLIPPTFGFGYTAEVSSSSGIIPELGDEDYVLDYNSGILFIQDIARIPTKVKAYLYIGKYGDKKISSEELSASSTVLSPYVGSLDGYFTRLTASNLQVANNLTVLGTASIAMLNTVNQQSLQIGDKHIIIMSGATDHATLSGSGILWGSGSTGPTYGPNGEHAYVRYDSVTDKLEIFPGLETNSITASSISASNFVGLPDTSIMLKDKGTAIGTITSLNVVGNGITASIASTDGTITLSDAGASSAGVVTTGTQTFAGIKTFANNVFITGSLEVNNPSFYGSIEVGGLNGAHVDLKKPHGDDYDIRLVSDNNIEGGGHLLNAGGAILALSGSGVAVGQYSNAGYKLLVAGTTRLADAVEIGQNGTLRLYDNATQVVVQYPNKQVSFYDSTNTATRMLIDTNGNVGIGTTNPSATLDVSKAASNYVFDITNASEANFKLRTYNSGSAVSNSTVFMQGLFYDTTENASIKFYRGAGSTGGFLTFTTNDGTERLRIDNQGNVGIGTTDLQKKFQVANYAYLDNDTGNEYAVLGARAASGGGNRLHLSASTISLGMSLTAPFSERAYATIDANGLEFGRGAEKRIIFNSDANYTSDKAFILYKDESSYHFAGGTNENSRLSIGVYNDFDSTNGEGLDLQGGGSLIFNVGSWDTELNSSIGTPGGTISGNPIKFRINNSDIAYFSSAGNLTVNGTISGSTIYGNGSGLTNIPNSSLVNSYISINSTQVQLGDNIDISTGAGTVNPGNRFRLAYYPNADGGTTVDDASDLYYRGSRLGIGVDPSSTVFKLQISSSTAQGGASINNTDAQYTYSLLQDRSWNLHLHSIATDPSVAARGHLVLTSPIADAVNPAALFFGVSGTTEENSYSWIQSRAANAEGSGNSRKILSLNPNGGSVGINTSTPNSAYALDVEGSTRIATNLIVTGTTTTDNVTASDFYNFGNINYYSRASQNTVGGTNFYHNFYNGATLVAKIGRIGDPLSPYNEISCSGYINTQLKGASGGTAVYRDANGYLTAPLPSDKRLKTNINNISNALEKISELNGVYYNWNCNNIEGLPTDTNLHVGLIAQEVEKVLPEVVYNTGIEDYKGVDYVYLTPLLIEGIKELKKQNDELKNTLNDILTRMAALENK